MKEGIFSPYAFRTQIIVCNWSHLVKVVRLLDLVFESR